MITKTSEDLYDLAKRILMAAGAVERNAEVVAEHLVQANLSGVDTHGVWHLKGYVDAMKAGDIVPTAWPDILKETPTSALVSGNWTFGQVAAKYAMEVAIQKAKEHDMAVVGLVQCHHIGRLGHYVEMAASEQMISMVWAGGFGEEVPAAVPHGGRACVLHTNPISMGFPTGDEPRLMFDYATTAASGVKLDNARRRGEKVPLGWVVDKNGNPTTDPAHFFEGGGSLPFGGHKGYALMMAAEYLGRVFTGANAFAEPHRGGAVMRYQGVAMIVFKADLFQSFTDYADRADEMIRRVRAVPPAPGFKEVLVPGDPEARARTTRQQEGIPIDNAVWHTLATLATSLGLGAVPS